MIGSVPFNFPCWYLVSGRILCWGCGPLGSWIADKTCIIIIVAYRYVGHFSSCCFLFRAGPHTTVFHIATTTMRQCVRNVTCNIFKLSMSKHSCLNFKYRQGSKLSRQLSRVPSSGWFHWVATPWHLSRVPSSDWFLWVATPWQLSRVPNSDWLLWVATPWQLSGLPNSDLLLWVATPWQLSWVPGSGLLLWFATSW